jgi:hypothetical protein
MKKYARMNEEYQFPSQKYRSRLAKNDPKNIVVIKQGDNPEPTIKY